MTPTTPTRTRPTRPGSTTARGRAGRAGRAVAAAVVLVALIVGVPVLLAGTIGNPADGWAALQAGDLSARPVLDVLAAIVWLAWAQFTTSVLVELFVAARHLPRSPRLPLSGTSQNIARTLVTSVLLISTASVAVAAVALPAHADRPALGGRGPVAAGQAAAAFSLTNPTRVAPTRGAPTGGAPTAPGVAPSAPTGSAAPITTADGAAGVAVAVPESMLVSTSGSMSAPRTYRVRADGPDTYWDIAQTYCGGGQHWRAVWTLNQGRTQPGGQVMTSPDLLRVGWTVLLPADTTNPTSPRAAATAGVGSDEVTVHPGDTLSGLAAAHGQPDWHKAWVASDGLPEPGGERFTDPNLIRPGWTVDVPNPSAAASHAPTAPPAASEPARPATPTGPTLPSAAPERIPALPRPSAAAASPGAPSGAARPAPPPAAPPASAPAAAAPPTATRTPGHESAEDRSDSARRADEAVAFGAGGGLLAAVTLAGLLVNRRRQFRWRRPGRSITSAAQIPPEPRRMERALLAAGSVSGPDVRWLDAALRGLAVALTATPDGRLPDVVAVRMAEEVLELILAAPHAAPPAPWTTNSGGQPGTRWSLTRQDTPPLTADMRARQFAPYPMLVSVGHTDSGEQWLLDLERVGALSLSGDRDRCLDLARFLAAELAHNTWSEMLRVTVAGFGRELAGLNPDRLRYADDPAAELRRLAHECEDVSGIAELLQVDVLQGRLRDVDGDVWAPHALLIAPDGGVDAEIDELLSGMAQGAGRSSVALVVAGGQPDSGAGQAVEDGAGEGGRPEPRWPLTVTADGRLPLPELGVELIAQQLPADEAAGLSGLLALSMQLEDQPMPPARGDAAHDMLADAAGGLSAVGLGDGQAAGRAPLNAAPPATEPAAAGDHPLDALPTAQQLRGAPARGGLGGHVPALHALDPPPWVANSMLPLPTQTYLERTPAAAADIDALAPVVPAEAAEQLRSADLKLAEDLAAWNDPNSPRPKLRLLGPVSVRATGALPPARPRAAWHTEVVAYLALHPHGAGMGQCAADLFPGEAEATASPKVRKAMSSVRGWLGADPVTCAEYLPTSPRGGARGGGHARFQVPHLLIDAELFRRLRLQALSRGADGITDLWTALRLVTGTPFDHGRVGGYAWLTERHDDHVYASMIYDVAHTVAVHHLGAGEPDRAIEAAQVALAAGSQEDTPLLDLMFACDAQGEHSQGDTYRQLVLDNHDVELPEDCPPATAAALRKREHLRRRAVS